MIAQNIGSERKAEVRERTAARNREMMDLYFDQGHSPKSIASDYGVSDSTIQALIRTEKKGGRVRTDKLSGVDPRRKENRKALSPMHSRLGVKVSRYMSVKKLNCTEFGFMVGLTRNMTARVMDGSFDVTLSQILKICEVIETDIGLLFSYKPVSATTAT